MYIFMCIYMHIYIPVCVCISALVASAVRCSVLQWDVGAGGSVGVYVCVRERVRARERQRESVCMRLSVCSLRGTKPLLQNFCAELEFLPKFLARSRTTHRILGFIPVSIIYFRRIAFVHTNWTESWPELVQVGATFAPSRVQ